MLRGAAGVGAVGLAAAAGVGAVVAATRPADPPARRSRRRRPPRPAPPQPRGEPLVVYLRDAASGEFDVFAGTGQVRIRDRELVARLLDGVRRSVAVTALITPK